MTGYFDLPDLIITMADQHQEMSTNTPSKSQTEAPEKEDIRMLGRMLGDTIREKEGEDTFNLVEKVRRTAVSFRARPQYLLGRYLEQPVEKSVPESGHFSGSRIFLFFASGQYRR